METVNREIVIMMPPIAASQLAWISSPTALRNAKPWATQIQHSGEEGAGWTAV